MELNPGLNFFGKLHHPALGIRIPEIFLPGIMAGLKKENCAAGFMLSFGRETATEDVINAPLHRYPITLGHTGTSILNYQSAACEAATLANIPIEIEADHLIAIGSFDEQAATRITGAHTTRRKISKRVLQKSLDYIFEELDEAAKLGYARCFTLDTSDLFDDKIVNFSKARLEKKFAKVFSYSERKRLLNRYIGKNFSFSLKDGKDFTIQFNDELVMKLALCYQASLETSRTIYQKILENFGPNFGFEISFDETENMTRLEDTLFYLSEWQEMGNHFDYFAPNIGLGKRADYCGSLSILKRQANYLRALVFSFNGALLSIHSGSGSTPYSGKGEQVYEILLSATLGKLKYKVSGVYYELLLEILSSYPKASEPRGLFEDIFDSVLDYCRKEIKINGPLATKLLTKQWEEYESGIKKNPNLQYNPRADFFRFHSYLALSFRDKEENRIFRNKLVEIYQKNKEVQSKVNREIQTLTESLIRGLKFSNNGG